jgi:hypothetical protein
MRDFPVKLCDRLLIPGSIKVSKWLFSPLCVNCSIDFLQKSGNRQQATVGRIRVFWH